MISERRKGNTILADEDTDFFYRNNLLIETTNCCNIRCHYCPNPKLMRPRGTMSLELFKKIIDDVAGHPKVTLVELVGMGETFLNPHIFEMIDYVYEKGIHCYTSTNGKWKFSEEKLLSILKTKHMHITIDGITNETYNQSRPDTDVNAIWDNVKTLVRLKEKMHSKTPHVEVRMNLFKFNKHEMFDLIKQCQDINVDSVFIAHGRTSLDELETTLTSSEWEKMPHDYVATSGYPVSDQSQINTRTEAISTWGDKTGEKSILDIMECSGFTIRWDGRATPCCFDIQSTVNLGNISTESLTEIWSRKRMKEFERQLIQNHKCRMKSGRKIKCDSCSFFTKYLKENKIITEEHQILVQPTKPLSKALQHVQNNDFKQAISVCQNILQNDPKNPDAQHLLGLIAYKIGNYDSAIDLIRNAIGNISTSNAEFHQNLGTILKANGKSEKAEQCFKEAIWQREYAKCVIAGTS